ncbi:thioredoxin family protein [Niabella yanshanensis]|uniref:Thioredoxin family protein n=1 Tax=Niabella yanshanensis TaxID=577386 RepID=A0ABZ0W2P4_9BACT|nr:thioredoxin family protein [Niabella yanshanensis]WQD37533.1 thioredoxin family protein [Niabella yanshanensis]
MKWLKYILITIAGILLLSHISKAQVKAYSFEQVETLQKNEKRNVVVFIYTNWCQYCQAMKSTTLENGQVRKMLNDQFYYLALNAEEKKDIRFNNKLFKYKPNGANTGAHELAEALGNIDGKLAYPALVVLNSRYEIVFQYSGFLHTKAMRAVLDNTLQ